MKKLTKLFEDLVEKLFFTVPGMIVFIAFIYFLMFFWMLKYAEASRDMKEEQYSKPLYDSKMELLGRKVLGMPK